jgi:hypothetical protein
MFVESTQRLNFLIDALFVILTIMGMMKWEYVRQACIVPPL